MEGNFPNLRQASRAEAGDCVADIKVGVIVWMQFSSLVFPVGQGNYIQAQKENTSAFILTERILRKGCWPGHGGQGTNADCTWMRT